MPDHCRNGLRRDVRAQLTGVDAVGGVEILGVGQLIKPPAHIGDQGVIFLCRFVVGLGQLLGHFVVVPALVRQLGSALLVGPCSKQNGDRSVCPDLPAEPRHAGKETLGSGDGAVAHLLEHHIVPLLVLERRLGPAAQLGVGVQLFRQPCPAPGVVGHLRPGQVGQHLGHIIGGDKAVAQHEDSHGTAPYSFISLFSTAIIHGSAERNKAGKRDEPIRFCGVRFKDTVAAA